VKDFRTVDNLAGDVSLAVGRFQDAVRIFSTRRIRGRNGRTRAKDFRTRFVSLVRGVSGVVTVVRGERFQDAVRILSTRGYRGS